MTRSTQWLLGIAAGVAVIAFYDPFPGRSKASARTAAKPSTTTPAAKASAAKKRAPVVLPAGQDKQGSLTTPKAKRGAQAPRPAAKRPPASQGTLTTPTKQSAAKKRAPVPVPRGASLTAPSKPGS